MSEPRTPRQIVLDMEPVIHTLCNGTDVAITVATPDHYVKDEQNGGLYIAESLDRNAVQLRKLWRELDLATR